MLYIHTALPAEARPLLDHYALRMHDAYTPFPLYAGDQVRLVVSGVGKTATAAAIAYAYARFADQPGPWINVGIAGHKTAPLGKALWVQKAVDTATDTPFFPALAIHPPCDGSVLQTVDLPRADYPADTLFDMEGSAFFQTAQRVVPAELSHSVKVVSDNKEAPWQDLDRQRVERWISDLLPIVEHMRTELESLAAVWRLQRANPPYFERALSQYRFSQTQQNRLRRLLQQWHSVAPDTPPWSPDHSEQSAAQVLETLEARLGEPSHLPY